MRRVLWKLMRIRSKVTLWRLESFFRASAINSPSILALYRDRTQAAEKISLAWFWNNHFWRWEVCFSSEPSTLGVFVNGHKLIVIQLGFSLQQSLQYEELCLWSPSLGTDSKQRHCLPREWRCFERRERAFLFLGVSWKPVCDYCCHQNTFSAKTLQYSSVQSSNYGLLDRVGCSAAVCCMAFDDSPHPWILWPSDWAAKGLWCQSSSFCGMVFRQSHHHQLWSPFSSLQASGIPRKRYKER